MCEAIEAKQRGSEAYKRGDYQLAIVEFSKAITAASSSDPSLHIYYSNRCASYLQVSEVDCALSDAEQCTRIKPNWAKGWSRLGNCLLRKNRLDASISALIKAVELDPSNDDAKASLADARTKKQAGHSTRQAGTASHQPRQSPSSPSGSSASSWVNSLKEKLSSVNTGNLQYQASMLWWRLTQNKVVLYGLIALVVYFLFFRSSSSSRYPHSSGHYPSRSHHYDSRPPYDDEPYHGGYGGGGGYGGYGGYGGGGGWDLWTIGTIAIVCWMGYKQGWHRNIQNMSPMTMLFLFNMLQNLLGGRRGGGGYGGYGGGYGRPMGMGGGFGRRRGGFF